MENIIVTIENIEEIIKEEKKKGVREIFWNEKEWKVLKDELEKNLYSVFTSGTSFAGIKHYKDSLTNLKDFYTEKFQGTFTEINLDEVFVCLAENGIKEVLVSSSEMIKIVFFLNANISGENLKLLTEGKTDKFLGIKLCLYDEKTS